MIDHLLSSLDIEPRTAFMEPAVTAPAHPAIFPLQTWLLMQPERNSDLHQYLNSERNVTIRKLTVAYAIGKLLEHVRIPASSYSQAELATLFSVDNFYVHVLQEDAADDGWEMIGVDMISPPASVKLEASCSFSGNGSYNDDVPVLRRRVDAIITRQYSICCPNGSEGEDRNRDESSLCHSLGELLYFVFSGRNLTEESTTSSSEMKGKGNCTDQPRAKSKCTSMSTSLSQYATISIMRLVQNLLEGNVQNKDSQSNGAYSFLNEVIDDMHILLLDPDRFLFDQDTTCLHKASDKLFGRTNEVSVLADTYRRVVSTRKSEAFIVGGYSG